MNFLQRLFWIGGPPASPPRPVDENLFDAVRDKAAEAVASLLARQAADRKRREEEEKRRRETDRGPQLTPPGEEPPDERRASLPRDVRYSISSVRGSLACMMPELDIRAFSRRVIAEVNAVYGGNPVPFYTAAELSRSAYSKLISHPDRHPAKDTVLAMAAAFKMDLPTAESFLHLAGYALSDSIPADLVWRECFAGGVHHLPQIRMLLSEFAGS